jgi:hypothetical protein
MMPTAQRPAVGARTDRLRLSRSGRLAVRSTQNPVRLARTGQSWDIRGKHPAHDASEPWSCRVEGNGGVA